MLLAAFSTSANRYTLTSTISIRPSCCVRMAETLRIITTAAIIDTG